MSVHLELKDNPVAKVMIDELIVRKKKLDTMEKLKTRTTISVIVVSVALFLFGFNWTGYGVLGLPFSINGSFGIILFLCSALGVARLLHLNKKTDKADQEFEELREEFIQRSEDFWKEDHQWKKREFTFNQLLKKYDINVFYR